MKNENNSDLNLNTFTTVFVSTKGPQDYGFFGGLEFTNLDDLKKAIVDYHMFNDSYEYSEKLFQKCVEEGNYNIYKILLDRSEKIRWTAGVKECDDDIAYWFEIVKKETKTLSDIVPLVREYC